MHTAVTPPLGCWCLYCVGQPQASNGAQHPWLSRNPHHPPALPWCEIDACCQHNTLNSACQTVSQPSTTFRKQRHMRLNEPRTKSMKAAGWLSGATGSPCLKQQWVESPVADTALPRAVCEATQECCSSAQGGVLMRRAPHEFKEVDRQLSTSPTRNRCLHTA